MTDKNVKSEIETRSNSNLTEQAVDQKIEALLFFYNEPIDYKKIAELLSVSESTVIEVCQRLSKHYQDRGLQVITSIKDVQMVALIKDDSLLEKLDTSNSESQLTAASRETLAIVMYLDECSEATIDAIRGVKSARTIKKLERRGYVNKVKNLYSVSAEAKQQLGITNHDEIPNYDSLKLQLESLAANPNE